MTPAADLHRKAMALADEAMLLSLHGQTRAALALYKDALGLEREAAFAAVTERVGEPTISILLRSAATLALDAQETREAERLVATALSMSPADDIANELRDLLEQIHFRRHLELRGIKLNQAEFQFAMNGPAVGFGIVRSEEFVDRVSTIETVLYRTAERELGKPYRDAGRRSKALQEDVAVYVSVPRAASFAVTFKLGYDVQLPLFEGDTTFADKVIDEVLTCFEMLDRRDDESIKERIKDQAYLTNFVALARKVAPDGDRITGIGFTAPAQEGAPREVTFRRRAKDIRPAVPIAPPVQVAASLVQGQTVTITGRLLFASELAHANEIRLDMEGSSTHEGISIPGALILGDAVRVRVPEGMMSDIVKPLWGERVTIEGRREDDALLLTNIYKAE